MRKKRKAASNELRLDAEMGTDEAKDWNLVSMAPATLVVMRSVGGGFGDTFLETQI